jgi:hypothetical protein
VCKKFQRELSHIPPTPAGSLITNGIRLIGSVAGASATADESSSPYGFIGHATLDYAMSTIFEAIGSAAARELATRVAAAGVSRVVSRATGEVGGLLVVLGGDMGAAYASGIVDSMNDSLNDWYNKMDEVFRRPYGIEFTFEP